jgi:hypothetical protein
VSRKRPAALRYLDHRRVDPSDVKLVVASHWHDDHVRGLDRILISAPAAQFVHPDVDDPDMLVELAAAVDEAASNDPADSGSPFGKVLSVLKRTGRKSIPVAGGKLFLRNPTLTIIALSPTTAAKHAGMVAVGRELRSRPSPARSPGAARRLIAVKPNLTSLVLWIETATHSALLGADLEAHAAFGWPAAIDESAGLRLHGDAQVLKVPHHGSSNADHERIWAELLGNRPFAALTPYAPSRLPRMTDMARLRARGGQVHGAASEAWVKLARPGIAAAFPSVVATARRESFGFVRFVSTGPRWTVDQGFL